MAVTDFINDLAGAITFIIAGFLAVNLALHLSQHKILRSDMFDITLWSLTASVAIYGIDVLVERALVWGRILPSGQLQQFFPIISLVLAVPIGAIGALLQVWDWGRRLRGWIHRAGGVKARVGPLISVWDGVFSRTKKAWLFVQSVDGKEYYGSLAAASVEGEPREILLLSPRLVKRSEDGQLESLVPIGEEMLFLESDIRRVVFYSKT